MGNRWRIGLALCLAAVAASSGVAAFAGNFGSTAAGGDPINQVSRANNLNHRVDLHNTTTNVGEAIQWAMNNALPEAGVTWELIDGDNYDVRVRDDDYGDNNVYAWVTCPANATENGTDPNRSCYGQRLSWNLFSGYDAANDTSHERRSRACHEIGHTFGLRHQTDDELPPTCMRTYTTERIRYLGNHDINHIDNEY